MSEDTSKKSNWQDWKRKDAPPEIEIFLGAAWNSTAKRTEWAYMLYSVHSDGKAVESGDSPNWDVAQVNLGNALAALKRVKGEGSIITIASHPSSTALALDAALILRGKIKCGLEPESAIDEMFLHPAMIREIMTHFDRHHVSVTMQPHPERFHQIKTLLTHPDVPVQRLVPTRKFVTYDCSVTGINPHEEDVFHLEMELAEFDPETKTIKSLQTYQTLIETQRPIAGEITSATGINTKDTVGYRLDTAKVQAMLDQAEMVFSSKAVFNKAFFEKLLAKNKVSLKAPIRCVTALDWKSFGVKTKTFNALTKAHSIVYKGKLGTTSRALVDLLGKSTKGKPYIHYFLSGVLSAEV